MPDIDLDVIVTYCNGVRHVTAAIGSALDQQDLCTRVIVVDDASDVALPGAHWPSDRVTVLTREHRGGHGAALNTGLAASEAPLVAFLDQDDLFPSYRSSALAAGLQRADLVYGAQVVFNDGDEPQLRFTADERRALPTGQPVVIAGTVLARREVFERVGPFPQDLALGAFSAWAMTARQVCVEVAVPDVVLLRRSHGANLSRGVDRAPGYRELLARMRASQSPPG